MCLAISFGIVLLLSSLISIVLVLSNLIWNRSSALQPHLHSSCAYHRLLSFFLCLSPSSSIVFVLSTLICIVLVLSNVICIVLLLSDVICIVLVLSNSFAIVRVLSNLIYDRSLT